MRALKLASGAVAGLLAIILVIAGVAALEGAALARWTLEHPVSRALGRQITVAGAATLGWGVPMRIVANDVHVAAAVGSPADLLSAQRLDIALSPASLVRARWHLPLVALDHVTVWLQGAAGGADGWAFLRSLLLPGADNAPKLDRLALADARLVFPLGLSAPMQATLDRLELSFGGGALVLAADGVVQQQQLQLSGKLGATPAPGGATLYSVDLDGALGDNRVTVRGTLPQPLNRTGLDLRLHLAGTRLDATAAALGLALPPLPAVETSGELSGGDGAWTAKSLALRFGHSDLAGEITVDARDARPRVTAKLAATTINPVDIAGLLGTFAPPATAVRGDRIIPATPVTLGALRDIGADLALNLEARQVTAEGVPAFDGVNAGLNLTHDALRVDPLRFGVAGGSAEASFTYNAAADPPELALDLDVRRIDLHRLVTEAEVPALFRQTAGTAGAFAHLHSSGRSLRELLERLEGDIGVFAANGQFNAALEQLSGPNVLQALGLEDRANAPMPVNCLLSRFALDRGVATATSLLLDTDASTVTGSGKVNLAAETIYIDLTPHPKHFDPLHLAAPIELRGTFAHPQAAVSQVGLLARLGAAIAAGLLAPPAALLPLVDIGLGEGNACARAFPSPAAPATGSSQSPAARDQRKPAR